MQFILKLFVILILLVLLMSIAQAQSEIVCKPADIQGRIVDEAGDPIAGAKVLVFNSPYSHDIEWYASRPEEDLLLGEATSDANGKFRIQWHVNHVVAIKNAAVNADILVIKPDYAIAFTGTSLLFESYLQLKLAPAVQLVGKVLDDLGKPLADAEVSLDAIYSDVRMVDRGMVFSTTGVCSLMSNAMRPRVKTDSEGNYRLGGLASGQIVLLQVTHPKFPAIRRMQPVDDKSPDAIQVRAQEGNHFAEWYNYYRKPLQMVAGKLGKMVAIEELTGKTLPNLEVCRFFAGQSTKSDQDGNLEFWLPDQQSQRHRDDSSLQFSAFGSYDYYARRTSEKQWSPAILTIGKDDESNKLLVPIRRTITGHIQDKLKSGIEGIGVYLGRPGQANFDWTFTDRNGSYSITTYGHAATLNLSGPKFSYILPVDKLTTAREESLMKLDEALHQRTVSFKRDQLNAEVNFAIPQYRKKQIKVVDMNGNPVRGTQVKFCHNITWLRHPATATSNENGIAEFDIDRPIIKSTAWVANSDGFGFAIIEGMSDEVVTLTIEPAIAIPGLLTAKASDGKLRNAAGIQIFLKHENPREVAQMDLATSDENGRFTIYLPSENEPKAKLYVTQVNSSSNYEWEVELNENARADFVMDDDRIP